MRTFVANWEVKDRLSKTLPFRQGSSLCLAHCTPGDFPNSSFFVPTSLRGFGSVGPGPLHRRTHAVPNGDHDPTNANVPAPKDPTQQVKIVDRWEEGGFFFPLDPLTKLGGRSPRTPDLSGHGWGPWSPAETHGPPRSSGPFRDPRRGMSLPGNAVYEAWVTGANPRCRPDPHK